MEAIVLGQKLQLQAEELSQLQLKQQQINDPTATELLQQAQADLVIISVCVCVCVVCASACVYLSIIYIATQIHSYFINDYIPYPI